MISFRLSIIGAALTVTLVACSAGYGTGTGGTSGATGSGVEDGKAAASSTPSERAQLCDWWASQTGGYGSSVTKCDGRKKVNSAASQAQCVSMLNAIPASCSATLGELQACITAMGARCEGGLPTECAKFAEPACGPFIKSTTVVEESDAGGGGTSCSTKSSCINGSCTCTEGPNADRVCCSENECAPTDPTSCEVRCKVCK